VLDQGELIIGTSADYPPFESMVKYAPQGFDIALLEELGRRLGVPVRFINFAFDGLDNALRLGPVDAVAAALSVTPDRLAYADFSDVYYVSQEAVLARADSPITSIDTMGDAARYRIAAQKDSTYEAWIRQNLIETGKLPAANLATYMLVSDAVTDLKAGRVDLLVVDAPAARKIVDDGGVKIVGQGLTQQRYAIAVPRGAVELRTKLNEALAAVREDGTLDKLTEQYLKEDASPLPPAGTEVPVAAATAPACIDNLALVEHVNFDPATIQEFDPGEALTKGWRVRNTGTCEWGEGYTLIFAFGDQPESAMNGQPVPLSVAVKPGEEVEVEVDLIAPAEPGEYQALWQMLDKADEAFGELLPVVIRVVGPTPVP
jgi:polar amino acid transport system substrate-binding protein